MQCPRCGLQNQPDITSCARCGLPVPNAPGAQRPGTQQPSPPPGGPTAPTAPTPATAPTAPTAPPTEDDEDQTTVIRRGDTANQPPPGPPTPASGDYGRPSAPAPSPYSAGRGNQPVQPGQAGQHQAYPSPGEPDYGQPGYGQPGYGQPGQHYGPGQYAGTGERPVYQGGVTPSSAWPVTTRSEAAAASRDGGLLPAVIALALGALLALSYAVWAFTARRGIFADFADGKTVSGDDARSSDNLDTILLIVAGLLLVVALALWVMRKVNDRTTGGGLDLGGLVATGVGVLVVLVGLFLSGKISDGADQAAQGNKGVTATMITGGGFLIVAIGLVVGILAVRGARDTSSSAYPPQGGGYQNW